MNSLTGLNRETRTAFQVPEGFIEFDQFGQNENEKYDSKLCLLSIAVFLAYC